MIAQLHELSKKPNLTGVYIDYTSVERILRDPGIVSLVSL